MADSNTEIQITKGGRITAGILLIAFTVFSIILIMAFWPDQLPKPDTNCSLYRYDWFDMTLDTTACQQALAGITPQTPTKGHININIMLLMLVAAGGFLGNMIHIATSFTTFVGAGKFQRSWVLWYWVRPFTASALALALYFAFGATKDPGNIDLDRILTLAILSGLFTDIATQKLKEVFDVLFNPKDPRPNKLTDPLIKITAITPDEIAKNGENKIIIKGANLKSQELTIKIDEQEITETNVTDEEISFNYTIPEEAKDKTELVLTVIDKEGNQAFPKKTLVVTENTAPPPVEGTEDADEKPVG